MNMDSVSFSAFDPMLIQNIDEYLSVLKNIKRDSPNT